MGITRGTTPEHTITLPFKVPAGAFLRIVYAQGETNLFEKTEKDCAINGDKVTVKLTCDDTLRFDCTPHFFNGHYDTLPVFVQIGVETATGEKAWSKVMETTVDKCLRKDGVIRNG